MWKFFISTLYIFLFPILVIIITIIDSSRVFSMHLEIQYHVYNNKYIIHKFFIINS